MTASRRRYRSAEDLLDLDGVSRESLPALESYVARLLAWQERINLIGPQTVEEVWHRHIADALQLVSHLPDHSCHIVDLGTGAGLPGLPIALTHTRSHGGQVTLVESSAKKTAFLREAIRLTGAPAEILNRRIESVDSETLRTPPDFIVSRALAPLTKLLEYIEKPLENRAIALLHKGRGVEAELTEARKYWKLRAKRYQSLTEPEACILKIEEATRVA